MLSAKDGMNLEFHLNRIKYPRYFYLVNTNRKRIFSGFKFDYKFTTLNSVEMSCRAIIFER